MYATVYGMHSLAFVNGVQRGRTARIRTLPAVIGSGKRAIIRAEGPTVRPEHAVLREGPDGLHIRPATADAPVTVNGERAGDCLLRPGDQIALGDLHLIYDHGVRALGARRRHRVGFFAATAAVAFVLLAQTAIVVGWIVWRRSLESRERTVEQRADDATPRAKPAVDPAPIPPLEPVEPAVTRPVEPLAETAPADPSPKESAPDIRLLASEAMPFAGDEEDFLVHRFIVEPGSADPERFLDDGELRLSFFYADGDNEPVLARQHVPEPILPLRCGVVEGGSILIDAAIDVRRGIPAGSRFTGYIARLYWRDNLLDERIEPESLRSVLDR
jgi:hypothetical protein